MKIVNFNTAYSTKNLGDFIIVRAVHDEMAFLFEKSFVYELPTHTPVATFYQCCKKSGVMRGCSDAKYKFIDGTNIIKKSLFRPWPVWNVNLFNYRPYINSILVGVGMEGDFVQPDYYTRLLYKKILSKEFIHSTRDEKTKKMLESMGYKAINTGCPTLWALTKDFCKEIPHKKASRVVFTLTDYCKDRERDQQLIEILKRQYKKVYFWVQGSEDLKYFNSFDSKNDIKLVAPNLDAYEKLLGQGDIDYVGTRLHAGIFAMRHKVRSIILIVDNRARDMRESYNLVAVERNGIDQLESLIKSSFETNVKIDEERISRWKAQFE